MNTEGPHDHVSSHAAVCAGIIRQAAPDAAMWPACVPGSRLTGKGVVFAAGLRWASSQGARVVTLSVGTGREDYAGLFRKIAGEAACAGVVLAGAASSRPAPACPAPFCSVIFVAAHDGQDRCGLDASPAPPAGLGAPGIDIWVPWLSGSAIAAAGGSFAASRVTGLAARLPGGRPHLTPCEVRPCGGPRPAAANPRSQR